MIEVAPKSGRSTLIRVLSQPLGLAEFAALSAGAVVAALAYCQLYCLIAFPPTGHLPMTLRASLPWSIAMVVPWLSCLELAKRRHSWRGEDNARRLGIVSLFVLAAAASIVFEAGLDKLFGIETRDLPRQAAAQLSAAVFAAGVVYIGSLCAGRETSEAVPAGVSADALLAQSSAIDWIEAAGNYVEVHSDGAVTLLRMTMRELERSLDRAKFRRIHRSAIVNLHAIEARVLSGGSPAVRMKDGTVLKLGTRYASNL